MRNIPQQLVQKSLVTVSFLGSQSQCQRYNEAFQGNYTNLSFTRYITSRFGSKQEGHLGQPSTTHCDLLGRETKNLIMKGD